MRSSSSRRPRVFVFLDHGRSLEAWSRRFDAGEVWDSSPYGYASAAEFLDVSFSYDRSEGPMRRLVRRALRRLLGFDIVHAARNFAGVRGADVVWTHTEFEHLAVASLLLLVPRSHRPHLISQSIWLWDRWQSFGPIKRRIYRLLLNVSDVHTVHSPVNLAYARSLGYTNSCLLPYGASGPQTTHFRTGRDGDAVRVIAPGNDANRDWTTLCAAAKSASDLDVTIVTRANTDIDVPNVRSRTAGTVREMNDLYSNADVVAVPLSENMHASGFTVVIEGLRAGRPVVATDTGGLRDIFGDLVHFAPCGDPAAFRDALRLAGSQRSAPDPGAVERLGLTAADFVHRHVLLTQRIVASSPQFEDVSALHPINVEESG